ncbi:MAG: DoxX family protein [Polynucleobacter victoriensis]
MNQISNSLALVGRLLMAVIFIMAGISKISGFTGTAGYIASVGLPMPEALTAATIVLEVVGGLALVVGYRLRLFAVLLAGFTLLAGLFFHNFWAMPPEVHHIQQIMFMKNLSIAGGLLIIAAFGGGAWSLDAKLKQE